MSGETCKGQSILGNLHKISLTSIEKAPVTQPNIYSLGYNYDRVGTKTISIRGVIQA